MKQLVKVQEIEGEGLDGLLGQDVLIFCVNYIYTGKLVGVNETFIKLEQPKIVYETGAFSSKTYGDAQALHVGEWYIQRSAIESFGVGK
jgi:hypothetical protein